MIAGLAGSGSAGGPDEVSASWKALKLDRIDRQTTFGVGIEYIPGQHIDRVASEAELPLPGGIHLQSAKWGSVFAGVDVRNREVMVDHPPQADGSEADPGGADPGLDLTLIEYCLSLSRAERLRQAEEFAEFVLTARERNTGPGRAILRMPASRSAVRRRAGSMPR
jgi:hypothetical protein